MSPRLGKDLTLEAPVAPVGETVDQPASHRPQTIVAPPPAKPRANGPLHFVLICALAGAVGLLYLFQTSTVAGLGVELTQLQREIDVQSVRNEELSYQLAYYESLPVIEELAEGRLGMQPMQASLFLEVQRPIDAEDAASAPNGAGSGSILSRAVDRLLGRGAADDAVIGSGE